MMKRIILISFVLFSTLFWSACAIQREADQKFGDQHFKTSISLIELHKIRFGEYPTSLKDLKFTGEWDKIALGAMRYKRVETGYELDVVRGWVGTPELSYPNEFWNGLGLVKSNIKP